MNREDVFTQVPGVGFQVAGRSVRSVSPEQTPLLNRKMAGGRREVKKKEEKNSQPVSDTAGQGLTSSPLVCSFLRRAFTRDGRNTKRGGIDFLLGGGGREGRAAVAAAAVGLTARIKLPSFPHTPLPYSLSLLFICLALEGPSVCQPGSGASPSKPTSPSSASLSFPFPPPPFLSFVRLHPPLPIFSQCLFLTRLL